MDIYNILRSKPHNPHYLNRYINFIEQCKIKNKNFNGYLEHHHICPRAKDMFPQYECFFKNPWNCASLTARQHYISHIMLWKSFPQIISCKRALWFMSNSKWRNFNKFSKTYENLKKDSIEIWKKQGKRVGKTSRGAVPVYSPEDGKIIKIKKDDPKYLSGILKHHSLGMRVGKNDNGHIIYADSKDIRFESGEYFSLNKDMVPVKDSEGNMLQVKKDDPRYISGELIHNTKDTIWINNGIHEKTIEKNSKLEEGWVRGRLTKNTKGTIWIKNVVTDERKRIKPNELEKYLELGFIRGR